jgi:hypothetical protein
MEIQSKAKELWFESLDGIIPSTKRHHLYVMDRFLAFSKIESLEALYQMKVKNEKSNDLRDATRVENLVKKFLQTELDSGLKAGTVRNSYNAIQSFFRSPKS